LLAGDVILISEFLKLMEAASTEVTDTARKMTVKKTILLKFRDSLFITTLHFVKDLWNPVNFSGVPAAGWLGALHFSPYSFASPPFSGFAFINL
jgi:hypothetical protein